MKQKFRVSLGTQIIVMILTMSIVLCATALVVSYRTYRSRTMNFYEQLGESLGRTLASQLDPEELDRYYETGELDSRYYQIQRFILDMADSNDVEYLYVVRPNGVGVTFLFDSDMELAENMDYSSGGYCALGTFIELAGQFEANIGNLLEGREIEPIIQEDPTYGWLMTACTPVLHENGAMAGYVMVDISMDAVMDEMRMFLFNTGGLLAAITLVFAVIYLLLARRSVIKPVRELTNAAESYEGGENSRAFSKLELKGGRELTALAEAFRMMLVEIQVNNMEQKELMVREQKLANDMSLARDLNAAMLPKSLPERETGYPFQVWGGSQQGQGLTSCFYDYFLLDRDCLCVIVGETPGAGVPQALYTVMAKATIKSHLTSGLSLAETMSASNRQIYEMGSGLYLNVLVGILDGTTGRFSCINAGQKDPLIMRSRDRYEWLDSFSFAPLGQSENVVYRTLELELRQGDRLFFHTGGLDEIRGRDGARFSDERLRLTLNERQVREADLAGQLQSVGDAGRAYAAQSNQIRGYATLALEFIRRDRAQAHCVVTPDAAGAAALQRFLKGQMQANSISGREMSQIQVLADEVFALCRRVADEDARFLAECTVSPEDRIVVLRLSGTMRGRDPLACPEGDPACHAVTYIQKNTEQISVSHEQFMDTVMLVKRLAGKGAVRAK